MARLHQDDGVRETVAGSIVRVHVGLPVGVGRRPDAGGQRVLVEHRGDVHHLASVVELQRDRDGLGGVQRLAAELELGRQRPAAGRTEGAARGPTVVQVAGLEDGRDDAAAGDVDPEVTVRAQVVQRGQRGLVREGQPDVGRHAARVGDREVVRLLDAGLHVLEREVAGVRRRARQGCALAVQVAVRQDVALVRTRRARDEGEDEDGQGQQGADDATLATSGRLAPHLARVAGKLGSHSCGSFLCDCAVKACERSSALHRVSQVGLLKD